MAYAECDLVPISALQHLVFCERQFALIHVEGVWFENQYTARGRSFHERVHDGRTEVRVSVVQKFGVPVRSLSLGVTGVTDAVEFEYTDGTLSQLVRVTPVEYKVGAPKKGLWDVVQVAAQAICLEEMTNTPVTEASLYYGKTRRRKRVELNADTRACVEETTIRAHELIDRGRTPEMSYLSEKCDACSLFDICKPRVTARARASAYFEKAVTAALQD